MSREASESPDTSPATTNTLSSPSRAAASTTLPYESARARGLGGRARRRPSAAIHRSSIGRVRRKRRRTERRMESRSLGGRLGEEPSPTQVSAYPAAGGLAWALRTRHLKTRIKPSSCCGAWAFRSRQRKISRSALPRRRRRRRERDGGSPFASRSPLIGEPGTYPLSFPRLLPVGSGVFPSTPPLLLCGGVNRRLACFHARRRHGPVPHPQRGSDSPRRPWEDDAHGSASATVRGRYPPRARHGFHQP